MLLAHVRDIIYVCGYCLAKMTTRPTDVVICLVKRVCVEVLLITHCKTLDLGITLPLIEWINYSREVTNYKPTYNSMIGVAHAWPSNCYAGRYSQHKLALS